MALQIGRCETACKFHSVRRVSQRPEIWLYNSFKHKSIANLALKIHYLGPRFPLFHSVRFVPFYNIIKPKRISKLDLKMIIVGRGRNVFRASDSDHCRDILLIKLDWIHWWYHHTRVPRYPGFHLQCKIIIKIQRLPIHLLLP